MEIRNIERAASDVTSQLNKFVLEKDAKFEKQIVRNIVEKVLYECGGQYDAPSSTCTSFTEEVLRKYGHIEPVPDPRLILWQKYLDDRKRLSEKIIKQTGKTKCDILMLNSSTGQYRIKNIKEIMDVIERIKRWTRYPDIFDGIESLQFLNCETVLERIAPTIPKADETRNPKDLDLTFIDAPTSALKEQGINGCPLGTSSYMYSKYLAQRISEECAIILEILSHYPEINDLEITGEAMKLRIPERASKSATGADDDEKGGSISVADIGDYYSIYEKPNAYVISINSDLILDLDKDLNKKDLYVNIALEGIIDVKSSTNFLTISNNGSGTVDFKWQLKDGNPCTRKLVRRPTYSPVFHFNKNPFRLIPGQQKICNLIFYSKISGLFCEEWILSTKPTFFAKNFNLVVKIFGFCKKYSKDHSQCLNKSEKSIGNVFKLLKSDLCMKAKEGMTKDIIGNLISMKDTENIETKVAAIASFRVHQPPIRSHYNDNIYFERNIFEYLNENPFNEFNLSYDEELKALNDEILSELDLEHRKGPWKYDLNSVKEAVLNVKDADKRRNLYKTFLDIVDKIRNSKFRDSNLSIRKENTFLVVKSILVSVVDQVDVIANRLVSSVFMSNLPLEFHEVIVRNTLEKKLQDKNKLEEYRKNEPDNTEEKRDKGKEEMQNLCGTLPHSPLEKCRWEKEKRNRIPCDATVVESRVVREKQKVIFRESFYCQLYTLLGNAIEEIVSAIETSKGLP